jgi:hypothetical protein
MPDNITFNLVLTEVEFTLENTNEVFTVQTTEVVILNAIEQGIPGAEVTELPWDSVTDKPNLSYVHDFDSADDGHIVINHNMRKYPAFRVVDSSGADWNGFTVSSPTLNQSVLELTYSFSGQVFCS